jgi:predicted anti-sigma-YlaC factor YlaD
MSEAQLSVLFGFLLAVGVVVDIWFGKSMRRRGLLQLSLAILYIVLMMTMPSCSMGHEDREVPGTF